MVACNASAAAASTIQLAKDGVLLKEAPKQLSNRYLDEFTNALTKSYLEGMKRVRDDLSWFIDKFDYRFENEPWKNSKDALQRMMMKQNSVAYFPEEKTN